jgi:hypothetical protein
VRAVAGLTHHGDDFLDLRRIGRISEALVAWLAAADVESGHCRRRTASAGAIEQQLGRDPSSGTWERARLSTRVEARPAGVKLAGHRFE